MGWAGVGCTVSTPARGAGEATERTPRLLEDAYVTADGARLPVTRWRPRGDPRATVVALHGFTEHRDIFYTLGPNLAAAGYQVIAYDQRGFGETTSRGYWPGQAALVGDARGLYRALRRQRPRRDVYVLGHSMGAAVATLAATGERAITPAGLVLVAPAFRSWDTLPWLQRIGLKLSATLIPGLRPNQSTGRTLAQIQVTDDPRIRRIQATDGRLLREIRFDMLAGVVELMSAARARLAALPADSLLQFAARDDMLPPRVTCGVLARLGAREPPKPRIALYAQGYHFLMRDRQRSRTLTDIRAWLADADAPLPSGEEHDGATAHARLCPERQLARHFSPAR
jgi:alpha-beta hydrolase superfamily lysophospholipase